MERNDIKEANRKAMPGFLLLALLGGIKEVTDNGIVLENKNGVQVVNLDYVIKLREYPYNKKGKRSTITDM